MTAHPHESVTEAQTKGPLLHISLQPDNKHFSIPRVKTVWQLLKVLGIPEETALVARDGKLLTPDQRLMPEETILVQQVGSRG